LTLSEVLYGHKIVIASFPISTPVRSQDALIDASVAAGVSRFFPSKFGTDTENQRSGELSVFANKVQALDYVRAKVATNPDFRYIALCPGVFLDWGLEVGFMVDVKSHRATLYDGGDNAFSTTRLETVSKAVVSILSHLEKTKNRHVYIQDTLVTQNKLIAIAKKLDGKDWEVSHISSAAAKAAADLEIKKEKPDVRKGLFPVLHLSVLGPSYGGDFSSHLDNELLGVNGLSDGELEDLVSKYL
jgi:hypothetical protein